MAAGGSTQMTGEEQDLLDRSVRKEENNPSKTSDVNHMIIDSKPLEDGAAHLLYRLNALWKLSEDIRLMDLGNGVYLIRFQNQQNYYRILQEGPWFIGQHFLTIRNGNQNFPLPKLCAIIQLYGLDYPYFPRNFMIQKLFKKWELS